jgi:hypothetical protein
MEMLDDEQALAEILNLAQETLQKNLPAIAVHLEQGDAPGAGLLLHSMKGFLPIFCTDGLVQNVSVSERLCKTGNTTEALAAVKLLNPQLEILLAEIAQFLKSLPQ